MSVGIKAGPLRTKLAGDAPSNASIAPEIGMKGAVQFDYRFNQAVSLRTQPGLIFQSIKYLYLDTITDELDSLFLHLNSYSIPLNATIWSENGRFFFSAGFEIDIYSNFKGEDASGTVDFKSSIEMINVLMQFGAGFIVSVGKPYLSFELMYSQGFKDLNSSFIHNDYYFPRTKLSWLAFSVGFHLPFGEAPYYQF